jgi:cobalamin biosynthesis Mg chelatase CobN
MSQQCTFAVSKGNYPCHIVNALNARGNWTQIGEEDAVELADFYWRQINFGYAGYDKMDKRASQNK